MNNLIITKFENLSPSAKYIILKAYEQAIKGKLVREEDIDHIVFIPNKVINFVTKKEGVCDEKVVCNRVRG